MKREMLDSTGNDGSTTPNHKLFTTVLHGKLNGVPCYRKYINLCRNAKKSRYYVCSCLIRLGLFPF